MVFINLYWKDDHSGKPVHSVSINPILSTIKLLRWFIVCQQVTMMLDAGKLLSELHKPVRRYLIESTYLLKVAQTVWYLTRPGWPLQEDCNEIDSNFSQFLLLCGNHDTKVEQIQQHKISMLMPDTTYPITIAIASSWSCS